MGVAVLGPLLDADSAEATPQDSKALNPHTTILLATLRFQQSRLNNSTGMVISPALTATEGLSYCACHKRNSILPRA